MEISSNMDLGELRDRMGPEATTEEAREMRRLLVKERDRGLFTATEEIPDEEWHALRRLAANPGQIPF